MGKRSSREQTGRPSRVAVFDPDFIVNLRHWVATDRRVALRILDLIEAVMREPFRGLGKPEPLRHIGRTVWSRRITQEHRFVYLVRDDRVDFLTCRFHY